MRKIAHISDLHFGAVNAPVLGALAEDLQNVRPDLIAVSGDLTQRATDEQFRAARAFLDQIPPPFLVVPGNHDVPAVWRFFERFFRPLARYRRHISPDLDQIYMDDDLAVVALNTARSWNWRWKGFWKDGSISNKQLDWTVEQFKSAPLSAVRMMITHHPPAPPEPHHAGDCTVNAAALVNTLEQCNVDLILSGHLHLSHVQDLRSHYPQLKRQIWTVQASTAISTRLRGPPNAYNLIEIDGATVKIDVREWKQDRFELARSLNFTRDGASPTLAEQAAARAPSE